LFSTVHHVFIRDDTSRDNPTPSRNAGKRDACCSKINDASCFTQPRTCQDCDPCTCDATNDRHVLITNATLLWPYSFMIRIWLYGMFFSVVQHGMAPKMCQKYSQLCNIDHGTALGYQGKAARRWGRVSNGAIRCAIADGEKLMAVHHPFRRARNLMFGWYKVMLLCV
jgi:hypothetical protein